MQYVGQTKRALKTRFKEYLLKIKKAKKIDTFLYQHFRSTVIHDHLVKSWFNLLKKLYTSPILPKDSKIF